MKSMNDERLLGVATERWPEWGLNPGPLNYYVHKWSEVIHNTQSAQISQKQDGHNVYVIMKTMCPDFHQKDFGNFWNMMCCSCA